MFGHNKPLGLYLNGQKIEQVMQCKYLGNIIKTVDNNNADIFSSTYSYLYDQGRNAIFGIVHKIRDIAPLFNIQVISNQGGQKCLTINRLASYHTQYKCN